MQTLRPGDTVRSAITVLELYQQPILPIIGEDDGLIGVLTAHSIAVALTGHQGAMAVGSDAPCAKVMVAPDLVAASDEPVRATIDRWLDAQSPGVVVVDAGRVVGLIGPAEICLALLEDDS